MVGSRMLSKQQIEQFNRDGFLLVRALYNREEMQEISVHRTAGLTGQLNIETVAPRGGWLQSKA